ncbi:MAG TPA: Crp/Fnr family transcriptional regulator [Puia sp.]|nr:Crp/Fnr family transcriptional regulator [Puia sp.]
MLSLFKYLRTVHPLSPELRDHLDDIVKEKKLNRKDYLLKAGQISGNIYFVGQGLLRSYYHKGGKEISSCFMKEGDLCIAVESFFTQQYGQENIQAIEDCVVQYITYEELQHIYSTFSEFNYIGRVLIERCYLQSVQRTTAMWMQKAHDRYHWFIQNFPELLQRVPAKYLASYLGITEVMLSNIKSGR